MNEDYADRFYRCLKLIFNREELHLDYLGFSEDNLEILTSNKKIPFELNKKLKVCLEFQEIFYQILKKVLLNLRHKGFTEEKKGFIENFCTLAYFQIPEFRKELLKSIQRESEEELKLNNFYLYDKKLKLFSEEKRIMNAQDWDKDFYRYLNVKNIFKKIYKC